MPSRQSSRVTRSAIAGFPLALVVSLLSGFSSPLKAQPSAQEQTVFRLRAIVALDESGQPVVDRAWLERALAAANELFAGSDIAFELMEPELSSSLRTPLITRSHRHALGPEVAAEVINVFVVGALANVDEEGWISGVHWRSRRGGRATHYVILSAHAGAYVLPHELGHFFGNPHSATPGNIMCYEDAPGPPFFDDAQRRRIERSRREFVRSGELSPTEQSAER